MNHFPQDQHSRVQTLPSTTIASGTPANSHHTTKSHRAKDALSPPFGGRARTACVACRKSKERCIVVDATSFTHLPLAEPNGHSIVCHRCMRLGIPCEVAPPRASSSSRPKASSRPKPSTSSSTTSVPKRQRYSPEEASRQYEGECNGKLPRGSTTQPQNSIDKNINLDGHVNGQLKKIYKPTAKPSALPVERLREWTLLAAHRKDLALIGATLSMAASCGESLESLLGSRGFAAALTSTLNLAVASPLSQPQLTPNERAVVSLEATHSPTPAASGNPSSLQPSLRVGQPPTSPISRGRIPLRPLGSEPLPPELFVRGDFDAFDPGRGYFSTMTVLKRISNGQEAYFPSRGFVANLMAWDFMEDFINNPEPTIPPYLHPEDSWLCTVIMEHLWANLTLHENPPNRLAAVAAGGDAAEEVCVKSCLLSDMPGKSPRVLLRQTGLFVTVKVSTQLVVFTSSSGQTTYTCMRMQLPDLEPVPLTGDTSLDKMMPVSPFRVPTVANPQWMESVLAEVQTNQKEALPAVIPMPSSEACMHASSSSLVTVVAPSRDSPTSDDGVYDGSARSNSRSSIFGSADRPSSFDSGFQTNNDEQGVLGVAGDDGADLALCFGDDIGPLEEDGETEFWGDALQEWASS